MIKGKGRYCIFKTSRLETKISNTPEIRMTHAQAVAVDLAEMMSHPERVMLNQVFPPLLTTFNSEGRKVQKQIGTLDTALRSEDEGSPPNPDQC